MKGILCILVFILTLPISAKWSDWSEWTWLTGDIHWRAKSNPTKKGGCEFRLQFHNKGRQKVRLSYEIVNGYGSDSVRLGSNEKKGTHMNYTLDHCRKGIQLDYQTKRL